MTELNERITALETNMAYVRDILAKREDYQNSVLIKLTTIELKQDQTILYQKTCDAERLAHASRLNRVENEQEKIQNIPELLQSQDGRIALLETKSAQGRNLWAVSLRMAGGFGGLVAFAVSVATLIGMVKHG